jgi:hypothetical protein
MIKVAMITQVAMIYTTASKKEVRNLILFKFCTNILYKVIQSNKTVYGRIFTILNV